jgi:hypothetical protein
MDFSQALHIGVLPRYLFIHGKSAKRVLENMAALAFSDTTPHQEAACLIDQTRLVVKQAIPGVAEGLQIKLLLGFACNIAHGRPSCRFSNTFGIPAICFADVDLRPDIERGH